MSVEKIKSIMKMIDENDFTIKERLGDLEFKDKADFDAFMSSKDANKTLKTIALGLDANNTADDIATRTLSGGNTTIGNKNNLDIPTNDADTIKDIYHLMASNNILPTRDIDINSLKPKYGYSLISVRGIYRQLSLNNDNFINLMYNDDSLNNLSEMIIGPINQADMTNATNFVTAINNNRRTYNVNSIQLRTSKIYIKFNP